MLMLFHTMDINSKDNLGNTSLLFATWNGNDKAVKVLLDNNAEIIKKTATHDFLRDIQENINRKHPNKEFWEELLIRFSTL